MGITTEASGPREDGGVNGGVHGRWGMRMEDRRPEGVGGQERSTGGRGGWGVKEDPGVEGVRREDYWRGRV